MIDSNNARDNSSDNLELQIVKVLGYSNMCI